MYRLNFIIRDLQYTNTNIAVVGAMFAISGCRSLLQSFVDTFLELVAVKNPNITVVILTLSIIVPDIKVFPVWATTLLFPVVVRWRNHLWALSLNLTLWKTPELSLEFRRYLP